MIISRMRNSYKVRNKMEGDRRFKAKRKERNRVDKDKSIRKKKRKGFPKKKPLIDTPCESNIVVEERCLTRKCAF